jgi:putative ABC transport system permease protein
MDGAIQYADRTAAIVILGIAVGYSLISVANMLAMAATGRRREFAALADGVRRQILLVVAAEAMISVCLGTLFVALAGAASIATQRFALYACMATPVHVPWNWT